MSNKQTKPLVPKLRFPEFRGTQGWSEGKVADIAVSESSSRALNKLMLKSDGFPVYGADSCVGFIDSFDQADDYIAIVKDGSGVGRLTLKKGESSTLSTLAYIKCKPGTKNLLTWLYYYLSSLDLRQFIKGSGIPHIYFSDYGIHRVLIPSPLEQQKIADCLSSLDELIAAQARKVNALKTHKKGLMQQLFPREGETQPRLRFPEFQNAGGWEEKKLEEIAKRGSGHTPNKSNSDYYNGGIKWVSLADSKRLDSGLITSTSIEISEKGIENSSAVLHPAGTVLISRDAGIGKSAVMSAPMAVSQHFIAWTCKPHMLSNWFLYHLLQNSKPIFERAATGSTIKTIGLQFFIDLKFHIPTVLEQERIADCFNFLDHLIAAEIRIFEALKKQKKGLMQQLFPSTYEATA